MSSAKGFSLIATVYIAPENVDKFLEHLQVVFDTITANPECEFFQVYRSPSEPGVLSWVEDWYVVNIQSEPNTEPLTNVRLVNIGMPRWNGYSHM